MSSPHKTHTRNSPQRDTFECPRCGLSVVTVDSGGTRRHHCPSCLHSRHALEHVSGGSSSCDGRMLPISIAVRRDGDWIVVHRCTGCGELTANPVATDDNQLILLRLAVRPLAQPPFPLESFGDL